MRKMEKAIKKKKKSDVAWISSVLQRGLLKTEKREKVTREKVYALICPPVGQIHPD